MGQQLPKLQELLGQHRQDGGVAKGSESSASLQTTLSQFYDFLVKVHCDENLQFWLMTAQYEGSEEETAWNIERWCRIYDTFIRRDSKMECNFPESIRTVFDTYHANGHVPQREDVELARNHVFHLLEDAYTRFNRHLLEVTEGIATPGSAVATPSRNTLPSSSSSLSALPVQTSTHSAGMDLNSRFFECAIHDDVVDWEPHRSPRLPEDRISGRHQLTSSSSLSSVPNGLSVRPLTSSGSMESPSIDCLPPSSSSKHRSKKQLFSKFKFGRRSSSSSSSVSN